MKEKLKAQKAHGFYDDVQAKDMHEQEKEILHLKKDLEFANNMAEYWRLRCVGLTKGITQHNGGGF